MHLVGGIRRPGIALPCDAVAVLERRAVRAAMAVNLAFMRTLVFFAMTLAGCSHNAGKVDGAAGDAGGDGALGPCAGLCTNPRSVPPATNSGDLGTGATCDEVVGAAVTQTVCGNFVAPRTFSVNGTPVDCATGGAFALPPPRNGGFCMQASAGNYSYAYFGTL